MPAQKPGKSKQCYGTPWTLIHAIEKRFSERFHFDLAATKANLKIDYDALGSNYYGPDHFNESYRDSFKQQWHRLAGLLWLNPEFADIDPWASKCYEEMKMGARIMFLAPSSTGANWFQKYCFRKAYVIFLKPRLVFEGETSPYPKDICLTYFHAGIKGQEIWDWKACLEGDRNGQIRSQDALGRAGRPQLTSRSPKTPQESCNHKFVDSNHCLKCGWIPPS